MMNRLQFLKASALAALATLTGKFFLPKEKRLLCDDISGERWNDAQIMEFSQKGKVVARLRYEGAGVKEYQPGRWKWTYDAVYEGNRKLKSAEFTINFPRGNSCGYGSLAPIGDVKIEAPTVDLHIYYV